MSDVGEKLQSLRTNSGSTLREICQQVGIPPSRLVEIERGVRIATPGQIRRLENFYKVTSGELIALAGLSAEN